MRRSGSSRAGALAQHRVGQDARQPWTEQTDRCKHFWRSVAILIPKLVRRGGWNSGVAGTRVRARWALRHHEELKMANIAVLHPKHGLRGWPPILSRPTVCWSHGIACLRQEFALFRAECVRAAFRDRPDRGR